MSLHQAFLHIEVGLSLLVIIAATLLVELVFQKPFYLLSLELQLCPDQVVRLGQQHRVDARRRGFGRIGSLYRLGRGNKLGCLRCLLERAVWARREPVGRRPAWRCGLRWTWCNLFNYFGREVDTRVFASKHIIAYLQDLLQEVDLATDLSGYHPCAVDVRQ